MKSSRHNIKFYRNGGNDVINTIIDRIISGVKEHFPEFKYDDVESESYNTYDEFIIWLSKQEDDLDDGLRITLDLNHFGIKAELDDETFVEYEDIMIYLSSLFGELGFVIG